MNNNSPHHLHCYSCAKQLNSINPTHKLQKHQYPVCNQKTDQITLEKHFLCHHCISAFNNIKHFVHKYHLKWFNKDFKVDKIVDPSFIKMSHFDSSFTKQNKRQSQIFESTSSEKTQQQSNQTHQPKQGMQFNLNLPNDIYSAIINDSIQSDNLHHIYWLPKTVQYLIHLTSIQRMRSQQRRERVKKTLQALSYIYCIDECDLKYLAIIVQTLFCYMDEEALLKILDKLLKGFLQNNVSLEFFLIQELEDSFLVDKSFQQRHFNKKPIEFRPDTILYIVFSLFILFDFFKDGKLQRHFSQLVHLSHQELNRNTQSGQQIHGSIQKIFEGYLKKNISDHSKLNKLNQASWLQMIEIKKQRNNLNLIIKTMKKQQQENQQIIKEMQNKYKKQKDEYINKIVKLNNQISDLEIQLKTTKQNGLIMNNSRKNSKVMKLKQQNQEVKSNPQMKHIDNIKNNKYHDFIENKNQPITERTEIPFSQTKHNQLASQIKKHKSQIQTPKEFQENQAQQTLNYLKSILQITDIISFNNKSIKKNKKQSASFPLPQLPNTIKELSQLIIAEINNLQKKTSTLIQQNKKLKQESTRLLSILKRKQESWLPLLHQKDQIISLYEKALICMEKGYILAEQPLSSRIEAIIASVAKVQFKKLELEDDNASMRESSMRDSIVQDFPQDLLVPAHNIEKQQGSDKKKTSVKQKKIKQSKTSPTGTKQKNLDNKIKTKTKTKKQKQKQTQCQIY